MEEVFLSTNSRHDWRRSAAAGEYVLSQDVRLQLLEEHVRNLVARVKSRQTPAVPVEADSGENAAEQNDATLSSTFNQLLDSRQRFQDKKLLSMLEEECKERLDDVALSAAPSAWKLRERMKTGAVGLIVCLNVGTDPPDVVKADPCARLQCWVDPTMFAPSRALEKVATTLQHQFEQWHSRARYRYTVDPTVDKVRKMCTSLRRNATDERVLIHYNGHGVPRPTANGELWVFNADFTQYIPLPIYNLKQWVGCPAIYTLDCSGAGVLLSQFDPAKNEAAVSSKYERGLGSISGGGSGKSPPNECIVLAACSANELLPASPEYPADIFTSCLTTPIKMALRWFVMTHRTSMDSIGITVEIVDHVPGKLNDRKTPLGELNWIFTAITDTIAWSAIPRSLFRKLFRQDILVASLFRNFLLAERMLKSLNCNPQSIPSLPPTWQHHLWQAWDMAVENCLMQLPQLLPNLFTPNADHQAIVMNGALRRPVTRTSTGREAAAVYTYRSSEFFAHQLTAFEVWLTYGEHVSERKVPEQLPIVLQVLLSSFHRQRALDLLARFLNLGSWATSLALSVGIFPYVNKLLLSALENRPVLIHIWSKILALDRSCQADLVKEINTPHAAQGAQSRLQRQQHERGHQYFVNQIKWLDWPVEELETDEEIAEFAQQIGHSARAAFVVSAIMDNHPTGQQLCLETGVLEEVQKHLEANVTHLEKHERLHLAISNIRSWLCFVAAKLCENHAAGRRRASSIDFPQTLLKLLDKQNEIATNEAAIFALGYMMGSHFPPVKANSLNASSGSGPGRASSNILRHRNLRMSGGGAPISSSNQSQNSSEASQQEQQRQEMLRKKQEYEESEPRAKRCDCVIVASLIGHLRHGSAVIRREIVLAVARLVVDPRHASLFQLMVHELDELQKKLAKGPKMDESSNHSSDSNSEESPYARILSKLQARVGENMETYLNTWLVLKKVMGMDPFPAVSRVAAVLHDFVRFEVQQRIEAIRSRAGVHQQENSENGNKESEEMSHRSANFDRARFRGGSIGARMMNTSASSIDTSGAPAPTGQQSESTQVVMERLGMVSTLYERRRRIISRPTPSASNDSWIPYDVVEQQLDPISADGTWILSWKRRNAMAMESALVLVKKGAEWARLGDSEKYLQPILAVAKPLSLTERSLSMQSNLTSSSVNSTDDFYFPASPSRGPVVAPRLVNGRPGISMVPTPEKKIQDQLDKLSSGKENVFLDQSFVAAKRAGLTNWKKPGKMSERVMIVHGQEQCSHLLFHPHEPFLVTGEVDEVAVWRLPTERFGDVIGMDVPLHRFSNETSAGLPLDSAFLPFDKNTGNAEKRKSSPQLLSRPAEMHVQAQIKLPHRLRSHSSSGMQPDFWEKSGLLPINHQQQQFSQQQEPAGATLPSRISSMKWMNESADPFLVVGSKGGDVRIWRDICLPEADPLNSPRLVSAWTALPELQTKTSGHGMVMNYQPSCGHLLCGGNMQTVAIWDVRAEAELGRIDCGAQSQTSCIASYGMQLGIGGHGVPHEIDFGFQGFQAGGDDGSIFIVGCGDGALRIFDKRIQIAHRKAANVAVCLSHRSWVVNVDVPSARGGQLIVSGSVRGEVRFWDIRKIQQGSPLLEQQLEEYYRRRGENPNLSNAENPRPRATKLEPERTSKPLRPPMTAMSHHNFAPVFACGSHHQFVHLCNIEGEKLSSIRFQEGFLRQRIGPVSALAWHPYKLFLAYSTIGPNVAIFSPQQS